MALENMTTPQLSERDATLRSKIVENCQKIQTVRGCILTDTCADLRQVYLATIANLEATNIDLAHKLAMVGAQCGRHTAEVAKPKKN